ncbi:MAG: hypothetical protein GF411_10180 [Candidatus Lokiarchaeota archaeon]|nr:hypothetical protein [Candidatus Lokiarchaeota archaeon]
MQLEGIFNLLLNPLVLILLVGIIVILIVAVSRRGPKVPLGPPILKILVKMKSAVEKGSKVDVPIAKTRQQLITETFEPKLQEAGIELPKKGGYIPLVASSDLSQKLVEYKEQTGKFDDDEIEATIEGIHAAETEKEVDDIAETVSDHLGLSDSQKQELGHLAREEWNRHKDSE